MSQIDRIGIRRYNENYHLQNNPWALQPYSDAESLRNIEKELSQLRKNLYDLETYAFQAMRRGNNPQAVIMELKDRQDLSGLVAHQVVARLIKRRGNLNKAEHNICTVMECASDLMNAAYHAEDVDGVKNMGKLVIDSSKHIMDFELKMRQLENENRKIRQAEVMYEDVPEGDALEGEIKALEDKIKENENE